MAKYNIVARRNPNIDWSAWCNTDDPKVAENAKKTIEEYGYEWSDEEPFCAATFKARCYALGIKPKKINEFANGRYKFTTADIEILETIGGDKK